MYNRVVNNCYSSVTKIMSLLLHSIVLLHVQRLIFQVVHIVGVELFFYWKGLFTLTVWFFVLSQAEEKTRVQALIDGNFSSWSSIQMVLLSSEGISQRQFLRSKQKWPRPEMLGKEELLRQKREVPLLIGLCSVSSSQFLCQIQTSCLVKIRTKRNFQFPVWFLSKES